MSSRTDIPTWYEGDEWTYNADVEGFGTNWSIDDGKIKNLKNKVLGIINVLRGGENYECYEIEITGTISGNFSYDLLSGELEGIISGTSLVQVSDLSQVRTEIESYGVVHMILDLDYEYASTNEFYPPLENFDFPIKIGEEWSVSSEVVSEGTFYLEGLYDESFSSTSWRNATMGCTKKEIISVPAGTFSSYKITGDGDSWYAPSVGNIIKGNTEFSDENTTFYSASELESFSRKDQPIIVSEDIFPLEAIPGEDVTISGKAIDSSSGDPIQNEDISIEIPSTNDIFTTTTNGNGEYAKTISAPELTDNTPSSMEIGSGGIIVRCTSGSSEGYRVKTLVSIAQNTPPEKPYYISGPTLGYINTTYNYTTSTIDVNYDHIFYKFDWGDGNDSEWIGPFKSEEPCTNNYSWNDVGTYDIKVKAKDQRDDESEWSEILSVNMAMTIEVDAGGPYQVEPFDVIQFNGSATGGYPPYVWYWDFGDSENSTLQNPTHQYNEIRAYIAVLKVTDNLSTVVTDNVIVTVGEPDETPPVILIDKPESAIYIKNNRFIPFLFPLIIGSIDIEISAYDESGIDLLELYIDDELKTSEKSESIIWNWGESTFGKFTIKIRAYDIIGNDATEEITVWRFF